MDDGKPDPCVWLSWKHDFCPTQRYFWNTLSRIRTERFGLIPAEMSGLILAEMYNLVLREKSSLIPAEMTSLISLELSALIPMEMLGEIIYYRKCKLR